MSVGKSGGSTGSSGGASASASASRGGGSKGASASGKGTATAGKSAGGSASTAKDSTGSGATSQKDNVSISKEGAAKGADADAKAGVNFDAWGDDDAKAARKDADADPAGKAGKKDDAETAEKKTDADLAAGLGDKTLRSGMHDESVRSLQAALNDKLGKELKTDGKFGPNTKEAVKEFQRQNGLQPDGIVGPKTREALTGINPDQAKKDEAKAGVDLPENVPTPTPRPERPEDQKAAAPGELSFGQKLSTDQKQAIGQMVSDLKAKGFDVKADDIVNFMAVETAGTFSPSIRSGGKKNGAVGLAQFTQIAVDDMNRFRKAGDKLTKTKIGNMSFTDQSKVVTEYLSTALGRKNMQGKNISASDLYAAVFSPKAIGKSANSTIYSGGRNYRANRSLDTNKDGKITKAELTARLNDWVARGNQLRG